MQGYLDPGGVQGLKGFGVVQGHTDTGGVQGFKDGFRVVLYWGCSGGPDWSLGQGGIMQCGTCGGCCNVFSEGKCALCIGCPSVMAHLATQTYCLNAGGGMFFAFAALAASYRPCCCTFVLIKGQISPLGASKDDSMPLMVVLWGKNKTQAIVLSCSTLYTSNMYRSCTAS